MRWMCILLAVSALAQTFEESPRDVKQGETLKVTAGANVESARMNGITIHLFPQTEGPALGLMPVPVLTKPGEYTLEYLDDKDVVVHKTVVNVADAHYQRQNITIAPAVAGLKASPGEQQTVGDFRKTVSDIRYWAEPLTPPVHGCLTSPFGVMRLQNGKPTGDFHAGVDQRGAAGTPIHPITAGVVKLVKKYNLRGGTVAVDHGQGMESIYLHMSGFAAKEGQKVTPADVIGYVGATGRATGPHVHWTLYVHGEAMNPGQWMTLTPCPPKPAPAKAKGD